MKDTFNKEPCSVIAVQVPDLPLARDFYRTLFDVEAELDNNTHAICFVVGRRRDGKPDLVVRIETAAREPSNVRNGVLMERRVDDVERRVAAAVSKGARVTATLPSGGERPARYVELVDPFGHSWAIACRLPDDYPGNTVQSP